MALTDEERQRLDALADEVAAELACTDPDVVVALAQELMPPPPIRHIDVQILVVRLLVVFSVPLAAIGVSLVQPSCSPRRAYRYWPPD
jgi:hypothetical protein